MAGAVTRRRRSSLSFERRLALLVAVTALPGLASTGFLLARTDLRRDDKVWLFVVLSAFAAIAGRSVHALAVRALRALANQIESLRSGDYANALRVPAGDDAFAEAAFELNALGDALREANFGAAEAAVLLRKVLEELDVALLAFDEDHVLRLANPAGAALLGEPAPRLLGKTAERLGICAWLTAPAPGVLRHRSAGGESSLYLRRTSFLKGGAPHTLLVVAGISRTLREEERGVWRRLIRVLSHEINNSLAPIASIARSQQRMLTRTDRPDQWEADLREGLAIVERRAEGLTRFLAGYTHLARLPPPRKQLVNVTAWVHRVVRLEQRRPVHVACGGEVCVVGDPDQLDQLLLNLLRNAVDALQDRNGVVTVGWRALASEVILEVEDDGPGLPDEACLFVPFFTTKPDGSGIGLVLGREIVEAHGGRLQLSSRRGVPGCVATIALPRAFASGG